MIITNCPKCGSMNITTAGVCANCGWSQFAQVTTESTRITGEIELKVSGKALLDDYKRLLLENSNLKERVAELERDFDMLFRSSANKQPRKNTQTLTLPPEVQE
jgi:predicted  nucleic acid-binding Zn-ribbon protein